MSDQTIDITTCRLTLVKKTHLRNRHRQLLSLWRCTCGKELLLPAGKVGPGRTMSCGCKRRDRGRVRGKELYAKYGNEAARRALTKHGMTRSRFYKLYKSMMNRCYRPSVNSYAGYGGRGITVDLRWHKFENFRDDMYASYREHLAAHPGSRQTSIERKDNDGPYSPENCCWATASEQALNRRPKNGGR